MRKLGLPMQNMIDALQPEHCGWMYAEYAAYYAGLFEGWL